MQIGGTTISTPVDKFPGYDPAWRHLTARLWVDNPEWVPRGEHRFVGEDKWVLAHCAYLKALENDVTPASALAHHRFALNWFNERQLKDARFHIEPLLLTGATYRIIWEDFFRGSAAKEESVVAYERLFFDTREADGRLIEASLRRQWLALPQNAEIDRGTPLDLVWKNIAHVLGYWAIMQEWGMEGNASVEDEKFLLDHLLALLQAKITNRTIRNIPGDRDYAEYHAMITNHQRLLFDTGHGSSAENETQDIMGRLLAKTMPSLLSAASTQDKKVEQDKAFASKVGSDPNIRNQRIIDAGAQSQYAAVNETLEAHLKAHGIK